MSGTCTVCKTYEFNLASHQKQDVFEAITPEGGCTWGGMSVQEVHAADHEEAARRIGEREGNQGDGPFEGVVEVRRRGETAVKRFNVTHDFSIDYYAREA